GERGERAPVDGQVLQPLLVDDAGDVRLRRLDERGVLGRDVDGLGDRADLQRRVDGRALEHVDRDVVGDGLREALRLDLDAVGAGRELRDFVDALAAGPDLARGVRSDV